jgi:hypothetical protein
MKYIFVDLDNTLISAEPLFGGLPKNAKLINLTDEKYWARLRPGALNLLDNLRKIGPTYMLTAATKEYALAWNKEFNLGFSVQDVYSREDYSFGKLDIGSKFPHEGEVYLIDDKDLPYEWTIEKVNFIANLGDKVNLIVIKPYSGHSNQFLDDDKIHNIVSQIV